MEDNALGKKVTILNLTNSDNEPVELKLHYGIASMYYLTEKYHKDIREIFSIFTKDCAIDSNFMMTLADVIYAGLWNPDDDGNDVSGWSSFKVMKLLDIESIPQAMEAVGAAISASQPKPKDPPTRAPRKGAKSKDGTGTISTPPQEQS